MGAFLLATYEVLRETGPNIEILLVVGNLKQNEGSLVAW